MERRRRRDGPSSVLTVLSLLSLGGCAALGLGRGGGEGGGDQRLGMAAALAEAGSWQRAESLLRQLASSCENGSDGRSGMLLLTSLLLDPRNPSSVPDSAALMAARFLRLPDATSVERPTAEALYAVALELGADPGLRPGRPADAGGFAERFSDCDSPRRSEEPLLLPTLEREPLAARLAALRQQRDSLAAREPPGDPQLRARNRALEARIGELEAELERIRGLLRGRDTTWLEPRPR